MPHLFVVNPTAGRQDATPVIAGALAGAPDVTIYRTTGPGDATRYLRDYLQNHPAPVSVYACGGDGTLHEVVQGAAGFAQASVGCYPCGSGNDFVKYYGGAAPFLDIPGLMAGAPAPIDLIKVNGQYAINACHFGFDTAVASAVSRYKTYPLMNGRRAYLLAVARAFVKSMKDNCTLTLDGQPFHRGDFLLCTIANGSHVGGAYRCAPRSRNDDGLMEVCLVDPVSRPKFLQLMGAYQRGEHLDDPRFTSIIHYRQAKKIKLAADAGFALSLDGEVVAGSAFDIEAVPRALNFILPKALGKSACVVA